MHSIDSQFGGYCRDRYHLPCFSKLACDSVRMADRILIDAVTLDHFYHRVDRAENID